MAIKTYYRDISLLCDKCHIIIKHNLTQSEYKSLLNERPHICKQCKRKTKCYYQIPRSICVKEMKA